MNLSALTAYITGKMEQTDLASVAFCKQAINARYQQIWDSQPWRDTLALVSCTSPETTNQAKAGSPWVCFPSSMERVLSVRWDPNTALHASDLVSVMDYNSELFNDNGTPIGFTVHSPVVAGPSTGGIELLQTDGDAGADDGLNFYATVENLDGSTTPVNSQFSTLGFSQSIGIGVFLLSFTCDPVTQPYAILPSGGEITPILNSPGTDGTGNSAAPRRPRIRLFQTPSVGNTLLAVCKRTFVPLAGSSDAPALTNIENALIAFAQADMLERNRQYAKAQAKTQEAQVQMQIMADLERQQTASTTRIIPADIHGDFCIGGFGSYGKEYW